MGNYQHSFETNPPTTIIFPNEIWLKIFKFLSPEDLFFTIPITCKLFYQLSSDNSIWKYLAAKEWNSDNLKQEYLQWVKNEVIKYKKTHSLHWLIKTRTDKSEAYDFLRKLLIIGDAGVGKSCVLIRYADNEFTDTYITTIGVDFKVKTIESEKFSGKVKLQIWDSGNGRERFRTITSGYYRGAHGIIICYDITNKDSFENVKAWLLEIDRYALPDIPKMIIGTKCDLNETRVIDKETAQGFCDSNNVPYFEVSSKNNINLSEAFESITASIVKKLEVIPKVLPNNGNFILHYGNKQKQKSNCSLQ